MARTPTPALLAFALLTAAPAAAQDELWAVQASSLYAIDVDGMRADLVGFTGLALVSGITEVQDGTLYATYFLGLATVDATTGSGNTLGGILPMPEFYGGLAANPATDRTLYSAGVGFAVPDTIHELDRVTRRTRPVVTTPRFNVAGLEFDATGVVHALDADADELFTVDPVTGGTSVPTAGGLAPWPRLSSLAIGRSGRVFSIHNDARLIEIDPTTGLGTDLGVLSGLAPGEVSALAARDPRLLGAQVASISLAAGGAQSLSMDVGVAHAGDVYVVLGSISGTSPGTPVSGLVVPLNSDGYTNYTLENPNSPLLSSSLGVLDSWGRATATFALPPATDPSLAGLTVHHAGLAVGATGVAETTTAAACALVP